MKMPCRMKFCVIPAILLLPAGLLSQIPIPGEPINTLAVRDFQSPVAKLRQLLVMTPKEQQIFLANKSDEEKHEILAKVDVYKALRPDERELKLKATELRWYLRSFIDTPATNRATLLAAVPTRDRKLVENRLKYWDQLPEEAKKQLQTNQAAEIYFSLPVPKRIFVLATNSEALQQAIQKLETMPEDQRQKILNSFHQIFELTSADKRKIMHQLPEAERQEMKRVLSQYENLPASQREICIESFEKFQNMSFEEQQQFLKNAERWRMMTPSERQQWKSLVEELSTSPPAPPEFPKK